GEGEWRSYEVTADGDHIVTKINGEVIADVKDSRFQYGHFGLQQHNPGSKIEFKNIKLKPLGLKPIFNGKDLSGWKTLDKPTQPNEKSLKQQWTVKDDLLHVDVPAVAGIDKGGQGQLETEELYKDFVLQLDVRVNGTHFNSGVFFRGIPNQFWMGYESQIRNQWTGDDRTKPVDFGTGGIYRQVATRKVVADDKKFFKKTIVAAGRSIGVWVDGYQVSDFTDLREPNDNPRNGYRAAAGSISLQSHDPTTDLDFRDVEIAVIPTPDAK
ncbi:MAG: 3-keto-disaccharide hydrolase, partial [Planctomycetia bacterium]